MALQIQTAAGSLEVTDNDLAGMFRLNPLALEQLKGIVLERALVAALRKGSQTDPPSRQETNAPSA